MPHRAPAAPVTPRSHPPGARLWHFALLGACSLALTCLGPFLRPVAPWYALWALLAASACRGRGVVTAPGRGAVCLTTASAGFLVPGVLSGRIVQSFTALAWLTALAAAGGAVAGVIGALANTPVRTAAAVAAASAVFLATPVLWRNQQPFPLALVLACITVTVLQARLPRHTRLLAAVLTVPCTALALSLLLTAPQLLTSLPVI
ncbi:hypothetical protein AB0C76_39785 [Kitasatospora sp. NPDC048722]|uniref:hypothetical protein n=1 Tax=Kitasatospora sp. NPDC048722 TaxID=3155639 RepID=UPI0033CC7983